MSAGSLFTDPELWLVGGGGSHVVYIICGWLFMDRLFMGRLFVGWVMVCGHGGAMSCVVVSWLAKLDQMSAVLYPPP